MPNLVSLCMATIGTLVSAANLLQNEISFSSSTNTNGNKLEILPFWAAIFNINNDIQIDPYLLMRLVSPAPTQLEFGTKFSWKNMIWAGFTYRTANNVENFAGDAASPLVGYTHQTIYLLVIRFYYI